MTITPADTWKPDFGWPYLFRHYPPTMEEVSRLDDKALSIWAQLIPQVQVASDPAQGGDPTNHGWILPSWQRVMDNWSKYHTHIILGGNRSTKSTFCSRLAVKMATDLPGARIRCWSTNEHSSINDQQRMVWEAIPAFYRNMRQKRSSKNVSIQWTQKNGFSGNKLIFPPVGGHPDGGEILFQTYKSYANDEQVAEGWWAHYIWLDEECPLKLYERLLTRIDDAKGRLIMSFTTIQGWTPLIADLLSKTRTLERRYSPLVGRELPVMQESLTRPGTVIWYFWTADNPFFDSERFVSKYRTRPVEERLAVCHGVPTRATGSKFPLFDDAVHVVKHEDLPWVRERRTGDGKNLPAYRVTRYMALDPAGSKNWFMLWVAVDSGGTVWVYREWPDESMGDWAEPSNDAKGKPGPAQRGSGKGIRDYIELIRDMEDEDGGAVFERVLDSRMGTAEKQGKEGATSIHTELEEEGLTFQLAPGLDIEHGLQLINNRLAYDTTKPLSATNAPSLYVSDRCQNMIFALKNFTGQGGKEEACKDPVDCLRYLLESGIEFVPEGATEVTGVGSY